MILQSQYSKKQVIDILKRQVEPLPGLFRCFFSGRMSTVCGIMSDDNFELRNRIDPFWSLRATGEVVESRHGTTIKISWVKPSGYYLDISSLFFKRYDDDKKTVLEFLGKWIKAKQINSDTEGSG